MPTSRAILAFGAVVLTAAYGAATGIWPLPGAVLIAAAVAVVGSAIADILGMDPCVFAFPDIGRSRVEIQGYGWPSRRKIRLSFLFEPTEEAGEVVPRPRELGFARTDDTGTFTFMAAITQIRGIPPPGLPRVQVVAQDMTTKRFRLLPDPHAVDPGNWFGK